MSVPQSEATLSADAAGLLICSAPFAHSRMHGVSALERLPDWAFVIFQALAT